MKTNILGLCLSGGGARGLAHIGVLKAFEEEGIKVNAVSGTSMGAVIAYLFAHGKKSQEIYQIAQEINLVKLFKLKNPLLGIASLDVMDDILNDALGDGRRPLIPLHVCVSNLNSGKFEIYSNLEASEWVRASASIPMLFEPKEDGENIYVDGGLLNNLPVEPLLKSCALTVGVNVNPKDLWSEKLSPELKDVALRCFNLAIWTNTKANLAKCDVILEPENMDEHGLFSFSDLDEIVEKGYHNARSNMTYLKLRIERALNYEHSH